MEKDFVNKKGESGVSRERGCNNTTRTYMKTSRSKKKEGSLRMLFTHPKELVEGVEEKEI